MLLQGPVWDLLRAGYCLKVFPANHQEALVSKHTVTVLPSLDALAANPFHPL